MAQLISCLCQLVPCLKSMVKHGTTHFVLVPTCAMSKIDGKTWHNSFPAYANSFYILNLLQSVQVSVKTQNPLRIVDAGHSVEKSVFLRTDQI